MNIPTETFITVPADDLRDLATRLGAAAGLPTGRASLLAGLLTGNDLRGNVSHGTVRNRLSRLRAHLRSALPTPKEVNS